MEAITHDAVDRRRELLGLLADGDVHSGAALARKLGVSRTAIWHYARELGGLGVVMSAVRGSGYQLAAPIELLDAERIRLQLSAMARQALRELDIRFVTDSTNQRLVELGAVADRTACLAEVQTGGRGRRGRRWLGEPGRAVCLSLGWRFAGAMQGLAGLSLVAGIGVHRGLCAVEGLSADTATMLRLKWPNDILVRDRKLGGILVEVSGEMQGPCTAVIGVGINVALSPSAHEAILGERGAQPATDLGALFGITPSRNRLAAALLNGLVDALQRFEREGFASFIAEWRSLDALDGRRVVVDVDGGPVTGVARGVDDSGALQVETEGGLRHFHGGEVRVRTDDATAG